MSSSFENKLSPFSIGVSSESNGFDGMPGLQSKGIEFKCDVFNISTKTDKDLFEDLINSLIEHQEDVTFFEKKYTITKDGDCHVIVEYCRRNKTTSSSKPSKKNNIRSIIRSAQEELKMEKSGINETTTETVVKKVEEDAPDTES